MGSTVLPVAIEKRSLVGGSVINRLILRPSAIRWAGEARGACDLHPTDDWLHPRISVCVCMRFCFFFLILHPNLLRIENKILRVSEG